MVDNKKKSITSNTQIEQVLGEYGILCIEDLVHHVFTVGKHFDKVIQHLKPFKLKRPQGGWQNKIAVAVEKGGEYGNRKHEINEFLAKCM